jgi:molybdate transport system substrate-binding protein
MTCAASSPRVRAGRASVAVLALAALALTGCSSADTSDGPGPSGASGSAAPLSGDLVVFAASSLGPTFERIADDFEERNPGVTVVLDLGGSASLAQRIVAGAPADVFASASTETMSTVTDSGLTLETPVTLASNSLEIAVPPGNPGGVTGLADFADPDRTIALCAAEVPCGALAAKAFAAAGVTPAPDTLEQDVTAALTKVRLGEVDAALVYRTDVQAADADVEGIGFPGDADLQTFYYAVELTDAPQPAAALAFVDFLQSADAQEALADAGFTVP